MADPNIPPIQVPDDFTVWVGSDFHGQLAAVDRLLARAGLTDGADAWIAPPRSALVVTGDVVDRGPSSLLLARRLASLRAQAPLAGSLVAILEGNHEAQVLGGLGGVPEIFDALMTFGGGATLLSVGMRPEDWEGRSPAEIGARVNELAPDLLPTLWSFAPYARWQDVLFVHGGPVPYQELEPWSLSAERIWIRSQFYDAPEQFPVATPWRPFERAGFERVVFGHTPMEQPRFSHEGRALNLDTWRGAEVTLARIEPGSDLGGTTFLSEPAEPRAVKDAPVTAERIRQFDTELPAIVDAWTAAVRPAIEAAR